MKKKSAYKNALLKHTPEEILKMYRDSKIKLNQKEWKDLHRRIEKNNYMVHGVEIVTIVNAFVCISIIILIAINFKSDNFELIKECNTLKGHTCSRYEIQEMVSNGNNNR